MQGPIFYPLHIPIFPIPNVCIQEFIEILSRPNFDGQGESSLWTFKLIPFLKFVLLFPFDTVVFLFVCFFFALAESCFTDC